MDCNELKNLFTQQVEFVFNEGVGLRANNLKNYTGPQLQKLSRFAIEKSCDIILGKNNWLVDGEYIHDESGYFESQRLDDHIWYNGKIVMAGESRAWMDKPFSHMKYGVINTWLRQPHTARVTHPNAFFPILVLAQDVTEKTFNTLNYTYRLDNRIKFYNLSGQKRDSKADYFYRGYSKQVCDKYIDDLCNHLIIIRDETKV